MPRTYSIVTPVYDPPADVLSEAIESVRSQTYRHWQLILVDDASPSPHVSQVLRRSAALDDRIVVIERSENGGIVAASNDGVAVATGDFVALLDHDDTLVHDALALIDLYADRHPEMDYCYSDEDLLNPQGEYVAPFYKPEWSPERLRSQNYCGHLSVFSSGLLERIGGFRPGFDGSQDYDLFLRATEAAREIVHIPFVLYHWRQIATSVASGDPTVKLYAYEAGRRAIQEHCERVGIDATVEIAEHLGNYRLRRRLATSATTSVVIATAGASGRIWGVERAFVVDAVRSVAGSTSRPVEFVVVHDRSTPSTVLDAVQRAAGSAPLQLVEHEGPDSLSAMVNVGVMHARGEYVLLLDDDVEVITAEFLDPLLALASSADVGAVGPKMYFSDGRVQSAGHVYNGGPHDIMHGRAAYEVGPGGLLAVQREVSGLSGSCLLLARDVFFEVGGFTPELTGELADVDLSLKIRHCGLERIWTPHVEIYHFESQHRHQSASVADREFLEQRWGDQLRFDPYSNPNLETGRNDWVERGLR